MLLYYVQKQKIYDLKDYTKQIPNARSYRIFDKLKK